MTQKKNDPIVVTSQDNETVLIERARNNNLVVRGASITFVGMVFQQVVSFASGILITRMLGPGTYGVFSIARTLCESVNIFTKAGFDVGIVRYLGENSGPSHTNRNSAFLKLVLAVVFVLSLLPVIAIYAGGGTWLQDHVYQFEDFHLIMMVMVLSVPFMSLTQVLGGAFRGALQIGPRVKAELFFQPIIRLLIIAVLLLVGWNIWAVVSGTVLSFVLVAGYLLAIAAKTLYPTVVQAPPYPRETLWAELFTVAKYSSIISLTVSIGMLLARTDIIMLGYFVSSEQVGQYAVIQLVVGLLALFNSALNQAVAPLLAQLHKQNNKTEMRRLVHQHARWVVITTLPLFMIIATFGNDLMSIFGKDFATDSRVIALLALSQLVSAVVLSASYLLSMTGHHMLELLSMSVAVACNIILNLLLIPEFGMLGAAIATLIALILANVLRFRQVYRIHHIFPVGANAIRPAIIGVAVFSVVLLIADYINMQQGLMRTIAVSIVYVSVYAAVIVKFSLVEEDRTLLQKIANKLGLGGR